MSRVLTKEDEVRRPHLIEYDRNNPSPKFPRDLIDYIESLQQGLSESELAWIRDHEYFIMNIYSPGSLVGREIPGLRHQRLAETQYIQRYNADDYKFMMDNFLKYIPPGVREDLVNYCNRPNYRLTIPDGSHFYPITYNKDLPAWRTLISENARLHYTMSGRFENGKFLLSDGQNINFSDLVVEELTWPKPRPSDW